MSNLLKKDGATYQQFMTYIGKIDSLDELHYYFDIGKITDITVIKNRFKNVFENNAEDIFNKFWNNQNLRNNLFGNRNYNSAKNYYTDLVNGVDNNKLYSIINLE